MHRFGGCTLLRTCTAAQLHRQSGGLLSILLCFSRGPQSECINCTMVEEPPASRRPRYLTARYSKWLIPLLLILFICISSIIPSISKYTDTNNNVVDNESNSQIAKEVSFENDGVEDGQTTTDTPLKPWLLIDNHISGPLKM